MLPPADLDRLAHTELKSLVVKQWEELAELRRLVATLHDEIARLKGGSGRPNIKPSGMDKATEPKPGPRGEGRPKGGGKTAKLAIHEEQTIKVKAPRGSRFKGYTSFIVQDLMIRSHVVRFRCERWLTPDGDTVTVPRLVALLRALGIFISKRQVVRLLIEGQNGFLDEARDVLRAGLSSAAWITVDDTGARHKAANGVCTHIGNAHFAWFGTTSSKCRG